MYIPDSVIALLIVIAIAAYGMSRHIKNEMEWHAKQPSFYDEDYNREAEEARGREYKGE